MAELVYNLKNMGSGERDADTGPKGEFGYERGPVSHSTMAINSGMGL